MPDRDAGPHTPVAHALETARNALGIPVATLCERAGIARGTWYGLLRPDHRPVRETIIALAQVLKLDRDKLLRLAGFSTPTTTPPDAPGAESPVSS